MRLRRDRGSCSRSAEFLHRLEPWSGAFLRLPLFCRPDRRARPDSLPQALPANCPEEPMPRLPQSLHAVSESIFSIASPPAPGMASRRRVLSPTTSARQYEAAPGRQWPEQLLFNTVPGLQRRRSRPRVPTGRQADFLAAWTGHRICRVLAVRACTPWPARAAGPTVSDCARSTDHLAERPAAAGRRLDLLIEPINTRDIPATSSTPRTTRTRSSPQVGAPT